MNSAHLARPLPSSRSRKMRRYVSWQSSKDLPLGSIFREDHCTNNMKELAVCKVPCSVATGCASREDPNGPSCHVGTASSKTHLLRNGSTAKVHSLLPFLFSQGHFTSSLCFYITKPLSTDEVVGMAHVGQDTCLYVCLYPWRGSPGTRFDGTPCLQYHWTAASWGPSPLSLQPLWGWDSGGQQG